MRNSRSKQRAVELSIVVKIGGQAVMFANLGCLAKSVSFLSPRSAWLAEAGTGRKTLLGIAENNHAAPRVVLGG